MSIKVNSVRGKKAAKKAADDYNKSSSAKQVQLDIESEVVSEDIVEDVVEDAETHLEEDSSGDVFDEIEGLTKEQILDYAKENLGLDLDKKKKKSELIDEVVLYKLGK